MLSSLFKSKADIKNCFPSEAAVNEAGPELIRAYLRAGLERHQFTLAGYCLDFLQQHKTDSTKLRKDGTRSEFHEIRQAIAALSFIENGLISGAAERRHGPAEVLVCVALVHDLGEDFKVSRDQLRSYLRGRMLEDRLLGAQVTSPRAEGMIERVCDAFELITYKRDGQGVDGKDDLNVYHDALLEDPYALLAKYLDRNDNLATMIGGFTLPKQRDYLDKTEGLFSLRSMVDEASQKFPELRKAFESADGMMGALYKLGRFNLLYHPGTSTDVTSGKWLTIATARGLSLRDLIRKGEQGYCDVPEGFHPLRIQESRISAQPHMEDNAPVTELRREFHTARRWVRAGSIRRALDGLTHATFGIHLA